MSAATPTAAAISTVTASPAVAVTLTAAATADGDDRAGRYARRLGRFAALTLVAHAVLAALVYRDAADREVSGTRWAAITTVGGLLGVLGYLCRR